MDIFKENINILWHLFMAYNYILMALNTFFNVFFFHFFLTVIALCVVIFTSFIFD